MANLPSQHPALSLHLADAALTPLITSSSSESHLESLTSLAGSAITAQTAAQRANLGRPQRIMVEYPDAGPVVLQSFLDPGELLGPVGGGSTGSTTTNELAASEAETAPAATVSDSTSTAGPDDTSAPALIGLVVAPSPEHTQEARRAIARLEKMGLEFQREWNAQSAGPGGST